MAQPPVKPLSTLYETDLALWFAQTIHALKTRDFDQVDWEHLIVEVEGLAGRDKRELKSRLTTLFEHLLKRTCVNLPECFRGWDGTIKRSQIEIQEILQQSPSLRSYFLDIVLNCYADAAAIVRAEYDAVIPETCPFPTQPEVLLNWTATAPTPAPPERD